MSAEPSATEFPRADFAHDLGDIRAWLTDEERDALAAINCPDIVTTTGTNLRLREDQGYTASGRRRRTPRHKLTPEQEEREKVASGHMEACFKAYTNPRAWLYRIGIARKQTHDYRMALLNERGLGEGPSPGWRYLREEDDDIGEWRRPGASVWLYEGSWCWGIGPDGDYTGDADQPADQTARAAMMAADEALAAG